MVKNEMAKRNRAGYMREYRARKRAEQFSLTSPPGNVAISEKAVPKNSRADSIPTRDKLPPDPAGVFAEWCERKLRIPPGHENQGKPFLIPDYGREFIADALEKARELALSRAEKCKIRDRSGIFTCAPGRPASLPWISGRRRLAFPREGGGTKNSNGGYRSRFGACLIRFFSGVHQRRGVW